MPLFSSRASVANKTIGKINKNGGFNMRVKGKGSVTTKNKDLGRNTCMTCDYVPIILDSDVITSPMID